MQSIEIKGDKYVIIPESEYQRMLEITEERIDIANIREHINDETFPSEIVEDIVMHGVSPIKVFRQHRKMTITALAKKVGVSQSYISDIENNKKDGSINVIKRIAPVLDVDIDMIVV